MSLAHHDHYALIYTEPTGQIGVRYSRCEKDLEHDRRFNYFRDQIHNAPGLGFGCTLICIVDDDEHTHPAVITARGQLPNSDAAHM